MVLLQDALAKVTTGTVYYGGYRAPRKVVFAQDGTHKLLETLKEGLQYQEYLASLGKLNCKSLKFSPYGITNKEISAMKNVCPVVTLSQQHIATNPNSSIALYNRYFH